MLKETFLKTILIPLSMETNQKVKLFLNVGVKIKYVRHYTVGMSTSLEST